MDARGNLYVDGGYCDPQYVSGYLLKSSQRGWIAIKQNLVCPMGVAVDAAGSVTSAMRAKFQTAALDEMRRPTPKTDF